jgi:hypothetical protein
MKRFTTVDMKVVIGTDIDDLYTEISSRLW